MSSTKLIRNVLLIPWTNGWIRMQQARKEIISILTAFHGELSEHSSLSLSMEARLIMSSTRIS